jgi:hypothetical protein
MIGLRASMTRWDGRPWSMAVLAFVGFLLMIGAWSVAAPYDGTPDEMAHIIRAAGVVGGQVAPKPAAAENGSGAFQTVPRGLVRKNCWRYDARKSAACAQPPSADRTLVRVPTGAGRYNPVYYALVGGPVRLWPGWTGVLLARLISAALCAALLAGAFVSVMRWSRARLMGAGLLAATTPMALQMASAVNPSGLEICAGIALFASAIPLLLTERAVAGPTPAAAGEETPVRPRLDRVLLWQVGISAALLAMLRAAGPFWLLTAFVALLIPWRLPRLRQWWRDRAARWWALALVAIVALSGIWVIVMKTTDLGNFRLTRHLGLSQVVIAMGSLWRQYFDEMVGVTSWLDTQMPASYYLVWQACAGTLLVLALVFGRWVDRWRLLVIFAGGVVVPTLLQVAEVNSVGFVTQGRYVLPVLVGLLLLGAYVPEERGFDPARSRVMTRLFVLVLLPLDLFALVYTMSRWQHGIPVFPYARAHNLNPLVGPWHPVLGSALPLVLEVVGLVLIGTLTWRMAGRSPAGTRAAEIEDSPGPEEAPGGTVRGPVGVRTGASLAQER